MSDSYDALVAAGLMTVEQAEIARARTDGANPVEVAVQITGHPEGKIFATVVRGTGLDATEDLSVEYTDPDAVATIGRDHARRLGVIPLRYDDSTLVIAASPSSSRDPRVRQDLTLMLHGQPFTWLIARKSEIAAKIDTEYRNDAQISELAAQAGETTSAALQAGARMVDLYLSQAVADRASDIHFEPGPRSMNVRFRIDGVLVDRAPIPEEMVAGVISRIKVMADIDTADRRKPHDGRLQVSVGTRQVPMRVSTVPTVWELEKAVLRIQDNAATRMDLDSFEMNEQVAQRWQAGFARPHGMLLVTGPTGSGKSTTLYATLTRLATPGVNIVTVEDPVEYKIPGINQIQVNPKSGVTFATALRSILRQDPDIILVGEIRDLETATVAIEAALTGHLVLSSLHTNSAPEAAVRLVEMGIEPFLVASVVECALAQRLVRRLCDGCKQPVQPKEAELASAGFVLPPGVTPTFYEASPTGCARCSQGYFGRMAVFESVSRSTALEQMIVSGQVSSPGARDVALADGMRPMREDGWIKVAKGQTTIAEILRVTT